LGLKSSASKPCLGTREVTGYTEVDGKQVPAKTFHNEPDVAPAPVTFRADEKGLESDGFRSQGLPQ
jgi:hypothetical protein